MKKKFRTLLIILLPIFIICSILYYTEYKPTRVYSEVDLTQNTSEDTIIYQNTKCYKEPLMNDIDDNREELYYGKWLEKDIKRIERYKSEISNIIKINDEKEIDDKIKKLKYEISDLIHSLNYMHGNYLYTKSGTGIYDYKTTGAIYVYLSALEVRYSLLHSLYNKSDKINSIEYTFSTFGDTLNLQASKKIPESDLAYEQEFLLNFFNSDQNKNNALFCDLSVYILPWETKDAYGIASKKWTSDPFNIVLSTPKDLIASTLFHEIGHIFSYKALNFYEEGSTVWNTKYLPVFGLSSTPDESNIDWEDRISENFAEEFKLYMSKRTGIKDSDTEEKKTSFSDKNEEIFKLINEYYDNPEIQKKMLLNFSFPKITISNYDGDMRNELNHNSLFNPLLVVTDNPKFTISAFQIVAKRNGAHFETLRSNIKLLDGKTKQVLKEYPFENVNNKINVNLPGYGYYTLEVYTGRLDYKSNIGYSRVNIIYEDKNNPHKYDLSEIKKLYVYND